MDVIILLQILYYKYQIFLITVGALCFNIVTFPTQLQHLPWLIIKIVTLQRRFVYWNSAVVTSKYCLHVHARHCREPNWPNPLSHGLRAHMSDKKCLRSSPSGGLASGYGLSSIINYQIWLHSNDIVWNRDYTFQCRLKWKFYNLLNVLIWSVCFAPFIVVGVRRFFSTIN